MHGCANCRSLIGRSKERSARGPHVHPPNPHACGCPRRSMSSKARSPCPFPDIKGTNWRSAYEARTFALHQSDPFPALSPRPRGSPFSPFVSANCTTSRRGFLARSLRNSSKGRERTWSRIGIRHVRIRPSSVAYGLLPSPSLVHVLRVVEPKRSRLPIERDACQVCRAERVCTKTCASDPEDEDSHRQSRGVQDDGNAPRQD